MLGLWWMGPNLAARRAVSSINVGWTHACGVRTDSAVACWGNDYFSQATMLEGEFSSVSTGGSYNCGVRNDGSPAWWSYNNDDTGRISPPDERFDSSQVGYLVLNCELSVWRSHYDTSTMRQNVGEPCTGKHSNRSFTSAIRQLSFPKF